MSIERRSGARRTIALAVLVAASAGCNGVIGAASAPDGGSHVTPTPVVPDPALTLGPSPMRRINRVEYDNTVQDLFGLTSTYADSWPADAADDGFDNDVDGQGPTDDLVEQIMRSAEQVGTDAAARLGTLLPCTTSTGVDPTVCGPQFIEAFAPRVYRRPLTDGDRTALGAIMTWGIGHGGLATGARLVITAMLESPSFLYRPEFGVPAVGTQPAPGTIALSDVEIASRLSYLLINSTPDDALLTAAEAGQLHTPDQLRAQATRLLATARGRAAVDRFFHQWLPFARLAASVKSPTDFPQFSPTVRDAMATGLQTFVEHVVFDDPQGSLAELMTSNQVFVDQNTAPLYGLSAGAYNTTFQPVTLSQPRAGLLTQLGVMTALADNYQSSPVARGKFVFVSLLCQPMGAPPANLPAAGVPPPPDPTLTTRQRFDQHRSDPVCAACHSFMDPLGFAFENYDAIGQFRTTENSQPIDATGQVMLNGQQVSFDGAQQLGQYLAQSPMTRACFAHQWFTYAFGRSNVDADQGTIDAMATALGDGTTPIRQFLLDVTQRYAFTHRQVPVAAEACP